MRRDKDARTVLVLGLGRFGGGREAARFLARRGAAVRVADKAPATSLRDSVDALAEFAIDWRLGTEDLSTLDDVELVVVNPAIPSDHPIVLAATARGIEISQEVSLFLDDYPGGVVLVSGTNGKSTTTTLLAAALERTGIDTLCGGNIGHSLLADESRWRADQIAVLEISSFQLERLDPRRHRVRGAVFTPVTRDHLDRHGSLAAYHRAKAVAAACAIEFVVHGAGDEVAAGFVTAAPERLLHRRGPRQPGDAAWVDRGTVWIDGRNGPAPLLRIDALNLIGAFHVDNAMAAALAATRCAADRHATGLAIALQRPLPYRLQLAAVLDEVRYFDNAISTSLESTLSALDSLSGQVRWVGGGKSKDGPEGFPAFAASIATRVASAHVFGAAATPLSDHLRALGVAAEGHDRLEEALASARAIAQPGDVILFSPGFASFDQFPNFRARAEAFGAWLRGGHALVPHATPS